MQAIKTLIEHAEEKYPHFESERGIKDIENAKIALNNIQKALDYVEKEIKSTQIIIDEEGDDEYKSLRAKKYTLMSIQSFLTNGE